jgi:hypothetical protein
LFVVVLLTPAASAQVNQLIDLRFPGKGIQKIQFVTSGTRVAPMSFVGDVDGDGMDDVADHWRYDCPCGEVIFGAADLNFTRGLDLSEVRHVKLTGYPQDDCFAGDVPGDAGDVDGDGIGDFMKAVDTSWGGVRLSGIVDLIYGARSLPAQVDLSRIEEAGVRFARFWTPEAEARLGLRHARAGDLNGDGYGDLCFSWSAVGSENAGPYAGGVFLVYGGRHLGGDIDIRRVGRDLPGCVIQGAHGETTPGSAYDYLGLRLRSIAPLGDVNGDGQDDLVVSAPGVQAKRGAVYLVLGGPGLTAKSHLFTAHPGGPLVEILGPTGNSSEFGSVVSGTGDVDGDGLADLLIGAERANAAYLIYGTRSWPASAAVDDGSLRVFKLKGKPFFDTPVGPRPNPPLGSSLAGIGDWDRDGLADFYVAAQQEEVRHGSNTGEGYLVLGSANLPATASVEDVGAGPVAGFTVLGDRPVTQLGMWVYAGGDLNSDGFKDFLVTADWPQFWTPADLAEPDYVVAFLGGLRTGLDLEVTGALPAEGGADGGDAVSIFGSGFRSDAAVSFGRTPAAAVEVISSAELRVRVPSTGTTGPVDVVVSSGGASSRLADGFRYEEAPAYRDIVLDPDALRAAGYRVMVFHDSLRTAPGFLVRQFISVFAADLNGDGRDELIVGQPLEGEGAEGGNGRVSIIFGSASLPDEIAPGETERYGTLIEAETDRWNMSSYITAPGDVDGDGFPDLVLGGASDVAQSNPASWSGATYVVRGRASWPAVIRLDEEIQSGGAIVLPHDACGQSRVAECGDLNGDGRADFLVGTYPPIGSPIPGKGCLGADAQVRLYLDAAHADADPPQRITGDPELVPLLVPLLNGPLSARAFGSTVSGAGDLNGDGFLDLIIGAEHQLGACYFVLGGEDGWNFREASITEFTERAVLITHEQQTGYFGLYAAGIGDFNGDGFDDALLGSPAYGRDSEGAAFVVFGSPDLGQGVKTLSVLREGLPRVMKVVGESYYDWNGYVTDLGDVNSDGLADFGITGDDLRNQEGRAYVIFGSRNPPERIELSGYLGKYGFRMRSSPGNWLSGSNGGMAAGDFDGDGFRDLAIGEAASGVRRVVVIFGRGKGAATFVRGDANRDGKVDLSDAIAVLSYLFLGGRKPACAEAGDANDSGSLELSDAIYLLNHLYLGGAPPRPPYPQPGPDTTTDALGCAGF